MKRLMAAMTVLGAVVSGPAFAEDHVKVIHEQDRVVVNKKQVVDFSGITVDGDLTKPEGSYVLDRNKSGFPTRIKLRSSFAPELQKSVDNL